jgi:hypothetical protein
MFIMLLLLPCVHYVVVLLGVHHVIMHGVHCVVTINNLGKFILFFIFVGVWY